MKRAAERKAQAMRRFNARSMLLLSTFALVALLLVGRSAKLAVVDREFLNREADARHLRRAEINAHRGSIFDRNGEPLAISSPVDSIWANPRQLAPAIDRFQPLAAALDTDAEQLMRRVNLNLERDFVYLGRHLRPQQVEAVNALALPGIDVQREYRRYYPAGEVVGHLLGFTDIDDHGQEGLELAFDDSLAGEPGAKRVLRDRRGRVIEEVESIRPPRHGQPLPISIDLRLQYFAYRELKRAMQQHEATSGSVVVLDVKTGEVLAMVNQPAFNPNVGSQRVAERYKNRAVTDLLEPGSSIKPLIMAAALQNGVVDVGDTIDTSPGFIQVGPKPITDKHDLGEIDLTTVLARSSNVGITKVAMRMQPEALWRVLSDFGLGQLSDSAFPGESMGRLNHHTDWSKISQATTAYGYGLSVTALQLARAYAAIGDGGVIRPVSLLALEAPGKGRRIVDEDVAGAVLAMMEHVVLPGGTGTKAAIPGYRVAGKTGTAWKYRAGGGYSEDRYLALFAGLVPASSPRLAAVVVIDEPSRKDYYGGDVAAPVFAEVMSEALRLLAIAPDAAPAVGADVLQAATR